MRLKKNFSRGVWMVLLASLCSSGGLLAQNTGDNLDFSSGDFTNWTGYTSHWDNSGSGVIIDPYVEGFVFQDLITVPFTLGRHDVVTPGADTEVLTGLLNRTPYGAPYAAKLGNSFIGGEIDVLEYTLIVNENNSFFIMIMQLYLLILIMMKMINLYSMWRLVMRMKV